VGQEREGAVVRLVEISDLACPYCGRLWENVQEYAASASHPVEIVLVHFPLDSKCNRKVPEEFHPEACQAARAVTCADRQGQFAPMVEALHASDSLRENVIDGIAMTVVPSFEDFQTCMQEEAFPEVIAQGIALAEAVELEGTPTLLVEGHRITGSLSPRAISRIVKCALEAR
jgi:protein-disulfide isomerase